MLVAADGLRSKGAEFLHEPQANMVFAAFPRAKHRSLFEQGAVYHLWGGSIEGDPDEMLACRLVCDWSIPETEIDRFVELV